MCILMVEDDVVTLVCMTEALEDAGYEVLQAEHAHRAIELIELWPNRFTMLVSDHNMPPHAMKGTDLAMQVRQKYPLLPIVIATAAHHEIDDQFRRRHSVHVLAKPYDSSNLRAIVDQLMADARLASPAPPSGARA